MANAPAVGTAPMASGTGVKPVAPPVAPAAPPTGTSAAAAKIKGPNLGAEDQLYFSNMRNQYRTNFELAKTQQMPQRYQIGDTYGQQLNDLGRQRTAAVEDLQRNLSGRGLATDPMFMGEGLADINNRWNQSVNQVSQDKAMQLLAMQQALENAQRQQDQGLDDLTVQEAMKRAQLAKLKSVGRIS